EEAGGADAAAGEEVADQREVAVVEAGAGVDGRAGQRGLAVRRGRALHEAAHPGADRDGALPAVVGLGHEAGNRVLAESRGGVGEGLDDRARQREAVQLWSGVLDLVEEAGEDVADADA